MTKNLKLFFLSPLLSPISSFGPKIRATRHQRTLQSANNKAKNGATIIAPERIPCGMLRCRGKNVTVANRHVLDKYTSHVSGIIIARGTSRFADSASVESIVHDPDPNSVPIGISIRRGAGNR